MNHSQDLFKRFQEVFGGWPRIFQAPGRVNLIGEHTDYNQGFVLPAAIQLRCEAAVAPASSRRVQLKSYHYPETITFDLDDADSPPQNNWSDYVRGVAGILRNEGYQLEGSNILISSRVPVGAGLSSSAALEVALRAFALLASAGIVVAPLEVARICHRAENEFVGARSGIMDQFTACYGRQDHALLLDCRSLGVQFVRLPEHVSLVACNTMVKHELASGEYNRRRHECEQGVAALSRFLPGIRSLRDVSRVELEKFAPDLDPVVYRRCRHVITENARVIAAAEALESFDLAQVGILMAESHESLRLDYEVSCAELDLMRELAVEYKGVYGARMNGGGFGGCVLALVTKSHAPSFQVAIQEAYQRRTGIVPEIYVCSAADGAGEVIA